MTVALKTAPVSKSMKVLDGVIEKACDHLLSLQHSKGYWLFDLEADATIPSEYLLLQRFLNREIPEGHKEKIVHYLRRRQLVDGGWPLYEGGPSDISATVKAYLALKLAGDLPELPHMRKAQECVLSRGGAEKANVFTRITLALFGQIPWHTTPAMLIEMMLMPDWFFFHLNRVSYWSRTVIVPLLILYAKRPVCHLRTNEGVRELFIKPPESLRHLDEFSSGNLYKNLFILLDRGLKRVDGLVPPSQRQKAIERAVCWTIERMQGNGGIGAIFPAMANAVMALKVLGYSNDDPNVKRGIQSIDDLLSKGSEEMYCQPCLSPVWDTCLSLNALLEAGLSPDHPGVISAVEWLVDQQVLVPGDWRLRAPNLEPGGWAFEFENTHYPDLDDTPVVLMALLRAGAHRNKKYIERISKGVNWIIGMQSNDGGWGAFDVDNNALYLNHIPFADHGALLDPSTSDLTARCMELLSMIGHRRGFPPIAKALRFLRKEQEPTGAWFGRWGVNYLYGTWSVLAGLKQVGEDMTLPYVRNAADWLAARQNPDGGWGETCYAYDDPSYAGKGKTTASQTAWALLGLVAVGDVDNHSMHRGIQYLCDAQNDAGGWDEKEYTGTGFPRVFYLRYHGYSQYFPIWALGTYRRLLRTGMTLQDEVKLKNPVVLSLTDE